MVMMRKVVSVSLLQHKLKFKQFHGLLHFTL
jgi:hypothetical protein